MDKTEHPATAQPESAESQGNTQVTRRLWAARTSAPAAPDEASSSDELRRLITRIRSIQFEPRTRPLGAALIQQPPMGPADPNNVTTAREPNTLPVQPDLVSDPNGLNRGRQAGGLPEHIDSLLGDPNNVSDPAAAAELLYLNKRFKIAAVFYRSALTETTEGTPRDAEDRAWAMFQLGNCLRDHDASAATDAYLKLIAEYPNSPWTPLARARGRLLGWQEKTKPKVLIADAVP